MSSPWKNTTSVCTTPCLNDVMSEELARELEKTELEQLQGPLPVTEADDVVDIPVALDSEETDDHFLALMLQREFDREYDDQLKREQAHINGNSKVTVSFEKYERREMTSGAEPYSEDEEEEEEDYPKKKDPDFRGPSITMNRAGYCGKGKNIQTKHDPEITGKKNASRLELQTNLATGDTLALRDMHLSNTVYNSLRRHDQKMTRSAARIKDRKDYSSTVESAMDERSRKLLFKQITMGRLEDITGIVSTGKESVVLHARGGATPTKKGTPVSDEVAIKVFKTTLSEFKTRSLYVNGDYRFTKDQYKKHNPRKLLKLWAEKEYVNLAKMRRFDLPCPDPLLRQQHILLMSFVGEEHRAAPKLNDAMLNEEEMSAAYGQCVSLMRRMLHDCKLVHGDFSEFNLLWWKEQLWIIDVSCAVDHVHPHALEFLFRDCRNISTFFMKQDVPDVLSAEELFNHLTGANIQGTGDEFLKNFSDYLSQLQDYEKDFTVLNRGEERTAYPFDHLFRDIEVSEDEVEEEDLVEDCGEENACSSQSVPLTS